MDDETFVHDVYDLLKPGGYFMIYNLHPLLEHGESYKAMADGRSPFARELFKKIGFEILAFNEGGTQVARKMGTIFGWAEVTDLEKQLFGTYTLLRK